MFETITLGPDDAEIDYTSADPIIHIFPTNSDPKKVIQDLIEGLFLLHKSKESYDSLNQLLLNQNDEDTKKMLNLMKKSHAHELIEAAQYAAKFVSKMKYK